MSVATPNKGPKRKQPKITLDQAAAGNPAPSPDHQPCPHCGKKFKVTGLAAHTRNCAQQQAAAKKAAMSKPRRGHFK